MVPDEAEDEAVEPGHDVGSVALMAIAFLVLVGVLSVLAMLGGTWLGAG